MTSMTDTSTTETGATARPPAGPLDLDAHLAALGIDAGYGEIVRAAIEWVTESRGWTSTEAFVALRWQSRASGRTLVESAAIATGVEVLDLIDLRTDGAAITSV